MAINGVPVVWMPASDEDYGTGRANYDPIAIVHHRGVATLPSIDRTFAAGDTSRTTVGAPGRFVSAHFAIGHKNGRLEIHQYVDLSDTAYCNGDCQGRTGSPSRWDGWYGHRGHNERTVSIEHEDNGGSADPTVKGLVTEDIIRASVALDRLLLSGDLAAIRAAGIRCRDSATAVALGRIPVDAKHLIDHNDIAGANKPYCWRPWKADKVGFPRQRFIQELTVVPEADMPALTTYIPGQVATVKASANVRSAPKLGSTTLLRTITSPETWVVTGWVKGDVDPESGSDQWLCRWAGGRWEYTAKTNLSAGPAVPPADCSAAVKAATDPLLARIKLIKDKVAAGASDISDD